MSNPEFAKCACRHCGGHIEFATAAAGQTVPCPHCDQPTLLAVTVARGGAGLSRRKWVAIGAALFLGAVPALLLVLQKPNRNGSSLPIPAPTASSAPASTPAVVPPAPVAGPPPPQPEKVTNDFAIMPFKLEKTPGSSLVYIIGTVRNTSDRQRFGIKVEFGLFDTNDSAIGSATDYQSVLDPHAEWRFKALAMASKTASARFRSIAEDQ